MTSTSSNRRFFYLRSFALALVLFPLLLLTSAQSWSAALPDFADLVENNVNTIVSISTVHTMSLERYFGRDQDKDFDELFRQLNPLNRPRAPQIGRGSGFIISKDGYVITNHHVVDGADEITVALTDRREFKALVIGTDKRSDIALLKIEGDDFPAVKFGDSEKLRVGEWVLAIGSPFGLDFSASAGIVSAKGRAVPESNGVGYVSFIQTDVAINRGNSGGPLFNLDGEVIGINSQILSHSGGSNGVSFSIPSNVALNVIEQLRESGVVRRGFLGVGFREVSYALAKAFGMDKPMGAFINTVQPDSPADRAGLREEDIIIQFDNRDIVTETDLPYYVGQKRPGTQSELTIIRDGKRLTLALLIGELSEEPGETRQPVIVPRSYPLGLVVAELPDELRAQLRVGGVIVKEIREGPAFDAGLMVSEVIVALNHNEVNSVKEFDAIVQSLPASGYIPVRIISREGIPRTSVIELD